MTRPSVSSSSSSGSASSNHKVMATVRFRATPESAVCFQCGFSYACVFNEDQDKIDLEMFSDGSIRGTVQHQVREPMGWIERPCPSTNVTIYERIASYNVPDLETMFVKWAFETRRRNSSLKERAAQLEKAITEEGRFQ